ncbi:MAG: DotA/TraY family protein [Bdellovibrionales bacterium]|jgi:conjugal transfer/type IV secretion protein DotA/TraY
MTNTPQPQNQPRRHPILKRLFGFSIGEMIKPLFDSTRVFLHLIAETFAIYKLLPKDYPGLQDPNASLSLRHIILTAWGNVRLTREGAPQALLFFTVIGVMIISTILVISALFSMFVGTAYAQTTTCAYSETGGTFEPACNDAAQMWLDFLFNFGQLPLFGQDGVASPAWGLQKGIQAALGFYSNAILIIAALILFYHLTTMVLQTAHSGKAMGNEARQIWAPIRLVMAIGLLVPISGGLNSGQYIVIKTAELGSGLASQTWKIFIEGMYDQSKFIAPKAVSPMVLDLAVKMIENYACIIDYNARIDRKLKDIERDASSTLDSTYTKNLRSSKILIDKIGYLSSAVETVPYQNGTGHKHSFSINSTYGKDACGYIVLPIEPPDSDALTIAAYGVENDVFLEHAKFFYAIAEEYILKYVSEADAVGGKLTGDKPVVIDSKLIQVPAEYQRDLTSRLSAKFADAPAPTIPDEVKKLGEYGWAFAGAFLSTIERIQGNTSAAAAGGVPVAGEQKIYDHLEPLGNENQDPTMVPDGYFSPGVRNLVAEDLKKFREALKDSWKPGSTVAQTQKALEAAQCASMLNTKNTSTPAEGTDLLSTAVYASFPPARFMALSADGIIDTVLMAVDHIASWNGVWKSGAGDKCGEDTAGAGFSTFKLSVSFKDGADVIQEIVRFGRANIDTGLRVAVWGIEAAAIGGVVGYALTPLGGAILAIAVLTISQFIALGFLGLGAIFAFLLPLIAFIRFFFGVLIWVGEVIESVIAIPVVALAHLNPDGEGFLSQQAKRAYEFAFSIFLRPIMTLFGLIAGLLLFIIAANFLNFAYGIAVAATGSMAYNHEILTRIVFTLLYVFTMFMCANMCFSLISDFPNSAVAWMAAQASPAPKIDADIKQMQQYETIAGAVAIDRTLGEVNKHAQGVAGKVGKIEGGGGPSEGGGLSPGK